MGGDKAEETFKAGHGGEGGGGLFGGQSTGGGEDARVYTPPVVDKVARRDLQILDLGRGGWGREVRLSGGLGGPVGDWGAREPYEGGCRGKEKRRDGLRLGEDGRGG
jgi:hypothetical protein